MTTLNELQQNIEYHLEQIERLFPDGWRLTLVARNPHNAEAEILLTRDNPDEVVQVIKRRMKSENTRIKPE